MYFGWITKVTLLSLLLLGVVTLGLFLSLIRANEHEVRVVFLSVGQGDAILIQSGHQQILIDGGREGTTLLGALGRELPFYDRTLDVVIATHPDADHVGGFPALLERYAVGQYIATGAEGTSDDFELLERGLRDHRIARAVPGRQGTSIELGEGGTLTLLYPFSLPLAPELASNEGSIVARFDFGETSFLLTGDLPHEEWYLPQIAPVDVLKAAHHGSASSTSDAWLDIVQPREVVLSVGKNSYGHPTNEVLERLEQRGITSWRTDHSGSIAYRCLSEENQCFREE